ncbi:Calmodulin (CaM) [Durusdinium trenchii]|uniref:Calmodulin (CaM) n=1 Tax=Durusdinium trenchii TaxID=1381693 RepID=A0ABP0QKX0_9DINO
MTSRKVRAKDFFSKFDESGDGQIDSEELMKGITFMSMSGSLRTSVSSPPPSFEDVQRLFNLIDADGDGTLDYVELDIVMKTVQERKSKQNRGANFFVKDDAELTELEQVAINYFIPLQLGSVCAWKIGEELGFTCKYEKFDRALARSGAMMLVDGNLDGAMSYEELVKVLGFVKVRMDLLFRREQDKKEELKNPFVTKVAEQTKTDNEKNYKIACFGLKAFIESLLRIGFGHLSFHGTPEQSTLPAATKALWVITHLAQQLGQLQQQDEGNVAEARNISELEYGYKPKNGEEQEDNPWSEVSNLDRIKCERPDLFHHLPTMRPVVAGKNYERQAACSECKVEPQSGWGNMYCPRCGHADGMIAACLANNKHYDLHKLPTLDKIICLLGRGASHLTQRHAACNPYNYCHMHTSYSLF